MCGAAQAHSVPVTLLSPAPSLRPRAEDEWASRLTPEDRCGLTLLFRQHGRPYGKVNFDVAARLSIRTNPTNEPRVGPIDSPREELAADHSLPGLNQPDS